MNFIYGTAWKEELTESCVLNALSAGYRAIDTANQRKHYYEEGVGNALARAYSELGVRREELFLQTKFTFARGQDHRKPYDPNAPFETQVKQSFESSLQHLRTETIDSYVLHGPSEAYGLTEADWQTWRAMEELCRMGKTKYLGVSNASEEQLAELCEGAEIRPRFVQNRCFAEMRWDQSTRTLCRNHGILYQGFSLLTANWKFLGQPHPELEAIETRTGKTVQQIVFRFAQQIGMIPLTGTRSPEHMKADLQIEDLTLSPSELELLENIAFL